MMGAFVLNDDTPVRKLTSADLIDGLDMTTPNYRAQTSFLKAFENLIQFDRMYFSCEDSSNKVTMMSTAGHFASNDYLINATNARPPTQYWARKSINQPFVEAMDSLMSDEKIDIEDRPYKNLYLGQDGKNISFSDDTAQCLGSNSDWLRYEWQLY